MKRKFQPKSKNTKYISSKQHGGKVLVEDDEVYKDENGNILQSDSYSHDDDVLIDENGNEIKVPEGRVTATKKKETPTPKTQSELYMEMQEMFDNLGIDIPLENIASPEINWNI